MLSKVRQQGKGELMPLKAHLAVHRCPKCSHVNRNVTMLRVHMRTRHNQRKAIKVQTHEILVNDTGIVNERITTSKWLFRKGAGE